MTHSENQRGFSFPGCFEITVFGKADSGLEAILSALLEALAITMLAGSLRTRLSSGGKSMSVTVSFLCPDRATYDGLYAEARAHPAIQWVL